MFGILKLLIKLEGIFRLFRNFYKIIAAILLSTAISGAQDILTFEEAVQIALEQNHQVRIARNDAEIAANNVHVGNAGLLPKVGLSAASNYSDSKIPTDAGDIQTAATTNTAQVQASYTIFDGFSNVNRFKRLKLFGEIGSLQARAAIENSIYRVASAYYNAALALENLQIARELAAVSSERYERATRKSQYGQANTIQVLNARVDLNRDSVTVTQAELRWDEARRNLNVLLNRDVATEFTVEPKVHFPEHIDLADLHHSALEHNASYLISRRLSQSADYDLSIARSARLPRVDLTSSYAYTQSLDDLNVGLDNPTKIFRAGANISLDLFNGFRTTIDIQNAQIERENQKLAEDEAKLQLETDIANAYAAYHNSRFVLELEEKNLEAAELNFKRTEELFNLGQVTNTQFREAQLNLIRAKNSISAAKYSAKLDEIELLRLSGRLLHKNEN